jgi:DNA helicase-2/ATP-dependent DNA helicase PcrA
LSIQPKATPKIDFQKGDMVQHTAFGRGMILSVIPMGNDALIEIAFDQIGTKKLMAKSASSHLKRL